MNGWYVSYWNPFLFNFVFLLSLSEKLVEWMNKNAFQWDAYRPLQWPSPQGLGGGGVCLEGDFCLGGGCLPRGVSA